MHVTNPVFFYKSGRPFYSWATSKGSFREAEWHLLRWDGADSSVLLNHRPSYPFHFLSTLPEFVFFFFNQNKGKPLLSTAHQFCHPFSWGHERTHSGTSQDEASAGRGDGDRRLSSRWRPFVWVTPAQNSNSISKYSRAAVREVGCILKYHPRGY